MESITKHIATIKSSFPNESLCKKLTDGDTLPEYLTNASWSIFGNGPHPTNFVAGRIPGIFAYMLRIAPTAQLLKVRRDIHASWMPKDGPVGLAVDAEIEDRRARIQYEHGVGSGFRYRDGSAVPEISHTLVGQFLSTHIKPTTDPVVPGRLKAVTAHRLEFISAAEAARAASRALRQLEQDEPEQAKQTLDELSEALQAAAIAAVADVEQPAASSAASSKRKLLF